MMVSLCAVFFPRDVLDEILNLIESVSEGFPSYFFMQVSQACIPYVQDRHIYPTYEIVRVGKKSLRN